MSNKQLETFFEKARADQKIKRKVVECGSNNSCIVSVGKSYGHKFSPATVSHWQRDHGGSLFPPSI